MPKRKAEARWEGNLPDGNGKMKTESGVLDNNYSFGTRFEDAAGTNPEELIGAALSGCFSMALAHLLDEEGHNPKSVFTEAEVSLVKSGDGFKIPVITLDTEVEAPGLDSDKFQAYAKEAKENCPVGKALKSVEVQLNAKLVS